MFGNYYEYLCLRSTICDNKKASCEALFLMGSVDIVLPSRDSARIANPQIDTAKKRYELFCLHRKCFGEKK
jgi:hypothetical protein